jgi:spore coat protein CotH
MTFLTRPGRAVRFVSAIWAAGLAISEWQFASAQNPAAKPADSGAARQEEFYRTDLVQQIDLRVAEQDMERMLAALPERIYVPASFRWREVSFDRVAVRFKGNSSSAPGQRHKRGFLIKFDEYQEDQRFLGLRRVALDNGVQFGSVFSEPIITGILREQGVKAHRCNYARLSLNEEYYGIYVNVERIDEVFIEHHLPDPNGLLFKVDEGGPGANLQFLGDDPSLYKRAFEPENKAAKKERRRLVEFIRMIGQSPDQDFAAELASKMELDDFLSTTAVLLFSGAFDQLTGWNPHNYYLYYDAKHDRWRHLPWDLDVGFCENAFGQIQVLADWNAAWPAAGQFPNPLLDRIVADPGLLHRYRKAAQSILDKSFEPKRLCALLDARYALIKDDLARDPFPHRRITNPDDRSYDSVVESMKEFIRKRYVTARRQLEDPGKRPEMARPPSGPSPQLAARIQRIIQAADQMQRRGEDVRPIQKLMQQVGPLLQQGKLEEAAKIVAEALKLVGQDSARDDGEAPRGRKPSQ